MNLRAELANSSPDAVTQHATRNTFPMQKSNINPAILQQMLDSAVNAADKGQSQFFTPPAFGQRLATGLPSVRPALIDLNCGNGQLLQASANNSTANLFGADIDPCNCLTKSPEGFVRPVAKIAYDLTRLYPLLKELDFAGECFVLNPPWRLLWHRDRLADLARSELPSIRQAFNAVEPGTPKNTIDSTIATWLIALDLMTTYGEALLIANNNTLERLVFGDKAPYAAIAKHAWLRLVIPGNPMTGETKDRHQALEEFFDPETTLPDFKTGVIYFAREHLSGPKTVDFGPKTDLKAQRVYRQGSELRHEHFANQNQHELWHAAKERVAEIEGRQPRVQWNVWLTANGRIRTALSAFQENSIRVNKQEAARLNALNNKAPMELVLQRNQRDELLHVIENRGTQDCPWRIQPELIAAVKQAIQDYHAARAPLYPLPEIQRLGYLDEQDQIICEHDLNSPDGKRIAFRKGISYRIRTQTVKVARVKYKPNPYTGEPEKIELSGQELAIYLLSTEILPDKKPKNWKPEDPLGTEFCFMDAAIKNDKETKVETAKLQKGAAEGEKQNIDFTLQELCESFSIPDVPDVATVNPGGYESNLKILAELESLCPA